MRDQVRLAPHTAACHTGQMCAGGVRVASRFADRTSERGLKQERSQAVAPGALNSGWKRLFSCGINQIGSAQWKQTTTTARPLMASEQLRRVCVTAEGKAADAHVTYVNCLFSQAPKHPQTNPDVGCIWSCGQVVSLANGGWCCSARLCFIGLACVICPI